ncbi:MAG: glycosyltransferase [Planctomycetaceae bacterium]|nr:glycosyltransferase [Planctomycetaceae bacterium]
MSSSTSQPLVSVIVPTYNRAAYIAEAVESALGQTYPHVEVVIVDDGSVDNTSEILAQLSQRDSRVRCFRQENAGVSAARNKAIQKAQGDFIAFLDSDDVWHPWKIELQLSLFALKPELGMVWTDMDAMRPNGEVFHKNYLKKMYSAYKRVSDETLFSESFEIAIETEGDSRTVTARTGNIYPQMFHGNLVHTSTVLLRKAWADEVGLFDTTMRRAGEDYKFHLATCRQGTVGFLNVASILYRIGMEDQITSGANRLYFAESYLRTLVEEFAIGGHLLPFSQPEINAILAYAHEWYAQELVKEKQRTKAAYHAWQAILRRRSIGNNWKTLLKTILPITAK